MAKAGKNYGNESISLLEGAERVRKRPGVIFGSDGLDGCEHAVFEILSNSIDEAREGHGKVITLTHYADGSIEVEDNGRGCPVDWNPKEKRFNWELVYCELYAGGKYNNLDGDNYEYSLGLNGLGACATQYASRYMDVTVWRDGNKYSLHFERGQITGKKGEELKIEPTDRGKRTGTLTRWLPDLDVFTDINIWNPKEKRFNWELVYCELYAGGKYNNLDGDNYEYSLGLNGLGACATQYASRYMDVTVWRDGNKYSLHFERGQITGKKGEELKIEPTDRGKRTGTLTRWLPDLDVFTDINIPASYFTDVLRRQAVVNAGITFRFRDQVGGKFETQEFLYENGIVDYVTELAGEGALTTPVFWETERRGRDREDKPEYKVKLSCACCFSNRVNVIEHYHNSSWLEHGGAPEKATKTAFVYAIDKYLKDSGKYQKNESKITWQDVEDCLVLVSNNFSTQTSYENQTKKSITNKFVQEAMTDFLKSRLETYFIENRVEALKIAEQVLINKRSRESAEKQRLNIKKKLSGSIDISNRVEKFVDCRTRDVSRREIYIVEGDSALGSVKLSRDGEFQGIMPVRGKILNCLKADYPRIFKSEIITDLLKVLGCGVEVPGKFVKDLNAFDINNLRWNKVILCTDADVDGFQIRTLILTMIYRLCPTLIREGYVYIAETPLFEITCGEKTWFAYTDKEKNDIVKTLEGKRYKVDRSKGLGENDPEMMWLTTMNPETRRLIKVMPEDAEATAHSFDLLLGDNLQGRKDHIAENGYKYLEMIDVS